MTNEVGQKRIARAGSEREFERSMSKEVTTEGICHVYKKDGVVKPKRAVWPTK